MKNKSVKRVFQSSLAAVLVFSTVLPSFSSSYQNLDEAAARKARFGSVTWGYTLLENAANNYSWQPESLQFTDAGTGGEVWRLTYSPGYHNAYTDISKSNWSANGKWLMFFSNRSTGAWSDPDALEHWMLTSSDGATFVPAKNSSTRSKNWAAYPAMNPAKNDEYLMGGEFGTVYDRNTLYRNSISGNGTISTAALLTMPLTNSRLETKAAITGDGAKLLVKDLYNLGGYCTYSVTLTGTPTLASFDNASCYNGLVNIDTFWGGGPTSFTSLHDNYLAGAVKGADGVWDYFMPESANGPWWRKRVTGTGANGAPSHVVSHAAPYAWGGQVEPAITVTSSETANDPWCLDTDLSTDCAGYPSHFTSDRWGRYGIATKSTRSPFGTSIWDNRLHRYLRVFSGNNEGVQHHDWEAWSDWSISSARTGTDLTTDRIVTQNYLTGIQNVVAYDFSQLNSSTPPYDATPRPTQSPDGTKAAFHSTFLENSDSFYDLYYAVAYYPYPPEIKSAAKNGSTVRLTWDFNQGTATVPNFANPRTYASRGWPHETNDRPPAPREIKQFRVWSSADNLTWSPVGTVSYNNEGGAWTETSWVFDYAQPIASSRYYAVTSLEYSGLESHTLSNVWKVVLDSTGAVTSQIQQSAYPTTPGGVAKFYSAAPAAPSSLAVAHAPSVYRYDVTWAQPADTSMIRYYNVYAKDGITPTAVQQSRIASLPKGTASYIDWAGNPDGSTQYLITSVDYQGNESASSSTASAPPAPKNLTPVKAVP